MGLANCVHDHCNLSDQADVQLVEGSRSNEAPMNHSGACMHITSVSKVVMQIHTHAAWTGNDEWLQHALKVFSAAWLIQVTLI